MYAVSSDNLNRKARFVSSIFTFSPAAVMVFISSSADID